MEKGRETLLSLWQHVRYPEGGGSRGADQSRCLNRGRLFLSAGAADVTLPRLLHSLMNALYYGDNLERFRASIR